MEYEEDDDNDSTADGDDDEEDEEEQDEEEEEQPSPVSKNGAAAWEVEEIIYEDIDPRNNSTVYLVKWVGWKDPTWEGMRE